ncbi:helix-turn-helix transcriptional regulator [Roseovarius salinarum]|uniref:helix-turn-helix transcriptional regulator n=1 Tax=Roseovarius salinarum TaxID=1981892 RepID=UPI001300070C|nr:WYL domain-containing protein [Roseovarius salinarum]
MISALSKSKYIAKCKNNNEGNMNLGWIEASLRYAGRFSVREKVPYQEMFGVSEATVSRHQARAAEIIGNICGEDVFERTPKGRLVRGHLLLKNDVALPKADIFDRVPSMERWLEDALGERHFGSFEISRATPDPHVLRVLIRAIQDQHVVTLQYQSRSGESERPLSPYVLVRVAGRLHLRGYDHAKNDMRDFVLTRILRVRPSHDAEDLFVPQENDREWQRRVRVIIRDKRDDQGRVRPGVQRDYSLDESGTRVVQVREAVAPYLVDDREDGFESPVVISKEHSETG